MGNVCFVESSTAGTRITRVAHPLCTPHKIRARTEAAPAGSAPGFSALSCWEGGIRFACRSLVGNPHTPTTRAHDKQIHWRFGVNDRV